MTATSPRYLLKKIIKIVVCIITTYTGYQRIFQNKANKKCLKILTYHGISNETNPDETVTPEEFEKQLQYIEENYKVISLEEAVEYIQNDIEKAAGSIVITFDDGYSDNYHYAYPLLRKYNFPATIFLISNFINDVAGKYLSQSQIDKMERNNISFGSHTISHRILSRLTNEEVVREISDSKAVLESRLGRNVNSFAYPVGTRADFNEEIIGIVKTCNYSYACSNMYGMNDEKADLFALKRIGIETTDNFFIFKKKIEGALNIMSFKDTSFFQRFKRIFFPL